MVVQVKYNSSHTLELIFVQCYCSYSGSKAFCYIFYFNLICYRYFFIIQVCSQDSNYSSSASQKSVSLPKLKGKEGERMAKQYHILYLRQSSIKMGPCGKPTQHNNNEVKRDTETHEKEENRESNTNCTEKEKEKKSVISHLRIECTQV